MNEKLEEKLESIDKRLEQIEKYLGIVQEDCSKMSNHIDFVQNIYCILRKPIKYFFYTDKLPLLKNIDK